MSTSPPSSSTQTRPAPAQTGGTPVPQMVWWDRRDAGLGSPLATRRPRQQPIFALARPRRMKGSARGVLLWSLGFYALTALALNLLMDRWCPVSWEALYRVKW